jgi:hypothetical protein
MVVWMERHSSCGFFINDLHRHPIAYYLIKIITGVFSSSPLVKNDAPISVRRGFTKKDWKNILNDSRIKSSMVSWEWAFRYLIVYMHELNQCHASR